MIAPLTHKPLVWTRPAAPPAPKAPVGPADTAELSGAALPPVKAKETGLAQKAALAASGLPGAVAAADPPPTRVEPVVDNLHGVEVVDNYRWLEDGESPEVKAWVEAQNAHTASHLQALPHREEIASRLRELLTVGSIGTPTTRGENQFYFKRDGDQNQSVYYKRAADGTETVMIDPNQWSEEGIEALDWLYVSPKGRYISYGRSSGGDEWSTMHLLDTQTGEHLSEAIPRTRAASVAWLPDESGFYYTKYPEPGTVPPGQENYNRHVFFHALGTDPAEDPKVFGEGLEPTAWPNIGLSEDGKHLIISASQGWTRNDLHVLNRETGQMTTIVQGVEAKFEGGEVVDGKLIVMTDLDAPQKRLMSIDLANPSRENWQEIVPERQDAVLQGYQIVDGKLFTDYLKDASSHVYRHAADGTVESELDLPGLGTVGSLVPGEEGKLYYSFSSYNRPSTIYKYDVNTGETDVWGEVDAGINPDDFEVKQEWFRSADGTRVPMFIVHKKGVELDGDNPTLLYGYGGFDISLTPSYSASNISFLENGGVYAVANLRGGGEFGKEWHDDGRLQRKQNVFDDFIAAGQHLVKKGYTNPEKMAVYGGSNGGLLVGAAVTQAPELFEAAVCAVPLLDMVRYDKFGIAQLWIPEYGTADNETQFHYINNYSPYQNIEQGTDYPATLFMAGARDSRTDPLHARKMAAGMQAANGGEEAILLRIEENAGHGQGKPIGKIIEAETDKWSFLYSELGVEPGFAGVKNSATDSRG